jgi:hypothetical protein
MRLSCGRTDAGVKIEDNLIRAIKPPHTHFLRSIPLQDKPDFL